MTPSLLDRLAQIRELQGKEPMPDPTRIAGFEPGAPPPPAWEPGNITERDEFADQEPEEPETRVSPLIQAAIPKPAQAVPESPPALPTQLAALPLELCVFDREAAYLGHGVTLNDREQRAVTAVVLKALQRVLSGQLQELRALAPKRARKPKPRHPETLSEPTPVSSQYPGKRRGRPRGSLLKGKP